MITRVLAATSLLILTACKFAELPPVDETDASRIDAASLDDGGSTQYTLTLTVDGAGTGAGSISVEPGGFTCSASTCTRIYDAGDELTITVAGASGVDGVMTVNGDCTSSPCSMVMDANHTVTAQFVRYACAPSTATCSNGMYSECDATGNFVSHVIPNGMDDGSPLILTMNNYACPMGCHASQPRCADMTLGNGVELALDTPGVSPTGEDIVLPKIGAPAGTIAINTGNFNASLGTIQVTDTDGATVRLPAHIVEQPGDAPAVLVIKARSFTLRAGSTLKVSGPPAFGIASHFDTYIAGTIDASSDWNGSSLVLGPGAQPQSAACSGGFSAAAPTATGGGGGACVGGASSTGANGGSLSAVRPPFVVGGCSGGKSTFQLDIPGLPGGGVMFASRRRVYVSSTALIDLTGTGGYGADNTARGGGSGGNLVVFAPLAQVAGAARIYARGGGGAAARVDEGVFGIDGPNTGIAGAGSTTCASCGTGGTGGYESQCTGGAGTGVAGGGIAGGGGAAGSCAFYSLSGAAGASSLATRCVRVSETLMSRSP
ncbi:MAG TPA: hypothetical protein VM261_01655 [Kofleriaceae bacterium]|nr:hypothetical protein [Kofleriaceae bacterium]